MDFYINYYYFLMGFGGFSPNKKEINKKIY